ncbi:NADH-quinone oxidoreductase subunit J [Glycomyces harbinensis]|uniref:NADH-quinone oxidoreductase subunit J n=1 Tax=Glycomyces harbinensis TaxID=58114 RepID=A0A1G6Z523_9ACTN|nr:NADH-quinone oxidoreductase subunit J [Glycomyces harbinensis]SDD97393.1 NADH-quinone oxidoreductase subunit J [Glycomyces harbinensis]
MIDLAQTVAQNASMGEAVFFWILAPIALGGAIGLVLARSAIHAALMLAVTMMCLAVFYIMLSAPFLGFVQIMVYTGAIMMLFLFVLMLFGRDSKDSMFETLRGQRLLAICLGIGLAALLTSGLARAVSGLVVPAEQAAWATGAQSNVEAIADALFSTYLFPFEVVSGVLTVAAVGALMFAHVAKKGGHKGQKEHSRERFAPGVYPGPRPGPGVFATSDSTATPALRPDGTVEPASLSPYVPPRQLTAAETAPKHTEGKDA